MNTNTKSLTTEIESLTSPAVELGTNYLRFKTDNISDEQLTDIMRGILTCNASTQFWLGDFLNYADGTKAEKYILAYATADYAPQTMYNAKFVCKTIPPEKRLNVSYSHHLNALAATKKDVSRALYYLKLAEIGNQTVSQMRKAINLELAPPAEKDGGKLIDEDKQEFLLVMDAIATINRFLLKTDSKTVGLIKGYIFAELELMYENAKAIL